MNHSDTAPGPLDRPGSPKESKDCTNNLDIVLGSEYLGPTYRPRAVT